MLSTSRRNFLFRISIVVNVAMLLYGAMYLTSRTEQPVTVEWEPVHIEGADRALHSVHESAPDTIRNSTNYESFKSSEDLKSVEVTTKKIVVTTPSVTKTETKTQKEAIYGLYNESTVTDYEDMGEGKDDTVLTEGTLASLRLLMDCKDKSFEPRIRQRGEFWELSNLVRAEHGPVACHESLTYTTHAGFEFLDNMPPLVSRWNAPVSCAVHAPGSDLELAINSIRYLRECAGTDVVRKFVTFHLFFSRHHMPKQIPRSEEILQTPFNCSIPPPYLTNANNTYTKKKALLYPVNVARNIARDSALTHYILPSDIELYPSPNLVPKFLNMIARNRPPLSNSTNPRVFPISIFEVTSDSEVPTTKTKLQKMLISKKAIPFHKYVCPNCHNIPEGVQWMKAKETPTMDAFHVGKRRNKFSHWEPIFIGTHAEPYYDERLSWEGKQDKMTQGYVLCVLDYDFIILNNAFLVHKPGIKSYHKDAKRNSIAVKQSSLIRKTIFPELKKLFGSKPGCVI